MPKGPSTFRRARSPAVGSGPRAVRRPLRGRGMPGWGHRRRGAIIELGIVESVSRDAATDAKKNGMCQRKIDWVIPPDADAEFAAHMEEVLETYARPLDCDCPVLCMDEQPVQRSARPVRRCSPPAIARAGSTTNTNVPVRRRCSCSASRCRDGGKPRPAHGARRAIGQRRSPGCSRAVTQRAPRSGQPQHAHQRRFLRTV